jgi:tRNA pseudouridine13 synthase
MSSESTLIHALEHDDDITAPSPKRIKLDSSLQTESVLPPSHSLLGIPLPVAPSGQPINFTEADVGISEYVARGIPKVEAIIKQRYVRVFHPKLY